MDDVLIAAQLLQPHRAAGVELLGGDAHLTAQAELAAVGEAGGAVDIHRRTVHGCCKEGGMGLVPGQDGLAVAGGVLGNVADGFFHAVHDLDGQNVVEKFGIEILRPGGGAVNDSCRPLVQPQFDRVQAPRHAGRAKTPGQLGQKLRRNGGMHKADFLGVADTGAAGLGVFDDVQRLGLVGGVIDEDVADAGAGLDAGNFGILHTGPDEPGPAARNEQVHKTNGRHQCVGGGVGGVLDEGDGGFRQTVFLQAAAQGLHDGVGRTPGLPAAAQDADVAALDGEGGGVAGHIGAALVDNGDDAHGHGGLFDDQTIGPLDAFEHSAHRVGQAGHFQNAPRHGTDALRRQGQTVEHHVGDVPSGGSHVLGVGGQNGLHLVGVAQPVCHAPERLFAGLFIRQCQCRLRGVCSFQNFLCRHGSALLPACKAGAHRAALGNVVQQLRVGAVGDDHVCAKFRHQLGGAELGGHAAGPQR